MAESQLKRQREENGVQGYDECVAEEEYSKRHKSYNDILSILELQEEDEPNQDLSDIFTSLEQELSSSDSTAVCGGGSGGSFGSGGDVSGSEAESVDETCFSAAPDRNSGGDSGNNESIEEDDERVRVMRHLLEASDDELGIPNRVEESGEEEETGSGDKQQLFLSGDWKWQFEDDAADYYYNFMHLQSELFI